MSLRASSGQPLKKTLKKNENGIDHNRFSWTHQSKLISLIVQLQVFAINPSLCILVVQRYTGAGTYMRFIVEMR